MSVYYFYLYLLLWLQDQWKETVCFLKKKIINFWHMEKNNSNAELHRALKDKFSYIWHPQYTTESCNISLDFTWMLNLHWERYLFWMRCYKNLFLRQKTWEKGVCSHCMDCFYYMSLIKKKIIGLQSLTAIWTTIGTKGALLFKPKGHLKPVIWKSKNNLICFIN